MPSRTEIEIGIISEWKLLHYSIFRCINFMRASNIGSLLSKVSSLLYTIGNLCS